MLEFLLSFGVLAAVVVVAVTLIGFCLWRWQSLAGQGDYDLAGKHVLVVGGSSGIGLCVAKACVEKGAKVSIVARNRDRLEAAKKQLAELRERRGLQTKAWVASASADVGAEGAVEAAVASVEAELGREVDVLVASAGVTNPLYFDDLSVGDFESILKVNVLGLVRSVKAVLPSMKRRRAGRLVFISSQVGQVGMFGYTAYAASKYAVRGFAECLLPEVKPYNILVSVSYPPDTDTPMYEEEMKKKPIETKLMSESGSVFTPESIAKDITYGIEHWQFTISHGFDGWVLSLLSNGLAPPSSFLQPFYEAALYPVLRLVWVFGILSGWYAIALKHGKSR